MKRKPEEAKWIVALTDGADTDSAETDMSQALRGLEDSQELNPALITLGTEIDQGAINELQTAAQQGSYPCVGMHVEATDLNAVKKAFEDIAKEMVAPSSGAV